MVSAITVRGARQHNLQNIDLAIPRDKLTVVTGLSGSGKSSLAFDTIYAEGQRRYIETLSPYARQFLERLDRPDVDSIEGLSPALSIEQKSAGRSSRSTVGTITEVYDYLRLLYAAAGIPHCTECGTRIERVPIDDMVASISRTYHREEVTVFAPVVRGRKGEHRQLFQDLQRSGFLRLRVDGAPIRLDEMSCGYKVARNIQHHIDVLVDRVHVAKKSLKRLGSSIRTASETANGLVLIVDGEGAETLYSERLACTNCGQSMPEFEPRSFSFNNPFGACDLCAGLGLAWDFDPDKLIPNPHKPLVDSGCPESDHFQQILASMIEYCLAQGVHVDQPWASLDELRKRWILYGSVAMPSKHPLRRTRTRGLIPRLRIDAGMGPGFQPRKSQERWMSFVVCPECHGTRLKPASLAVKIDGYSIADLAQMSMAGLDTVLRDLALSGRKRTVGVRVLSEICKRVSFLVRIGLDYLSLNRAARTLSGGEAQRVRLATQIGTGLRGVLYVLDEPSIGLHARDHQRLLDALCGLRDIGNTVLVVEHDEATIQRADHVVDIGPGAGRLGGHIVAQGPPEAIAACSDSMTGEYLAGTRSAFLAPSSAPRNGSKPIVVAGARHHNLKDIDVAFPTGSLCVVTGVSGSGKSTLVNGILYPAAARKIGLDEEPPGPHRNIDLGDQVLHVVRIDQAPIGRTPRSTPATYTGVMNVVRDLYAQLPESRARGYTKSRFSFNVVGGRCEACKGEGMVRIEMHFMPDVYVQCETCAGRRYTRETLEVKYKDHSIADLLEATVEEALELMRNLPLVSRKLQTILDVGLGYIQLGQSSTTLSGGEAQRMKLSRELVKRRNTQTLYVLDEPTTGLHFDDVRRLLKVLRRLVDRGATVIVIEHQMDVIRSADWIVDLGPEGGDQGGEVVCAGTVSDVMACEASHTGKALRELAAA